MNKVGGYYLNDGEVLRVSAGDLIFYVDDEQKYGEAMDYIRSRDIQLNIIEVISMDELI